MPRPRKPTALLEFTGAFRKDPQRRRARSSEPKLEKGLGEPPTWLDAVAVEEWWRVMPDLEKSGVAARVEATSLACYCQAVSRLRKAEEQIARDGITVSTPQGVKKHPAVNIAERAAALIRLFASDFGMTPASRSRVQAIPNAEQKPDNEFASV